MEETETPPLLEIDGLTAERAFAHGERGVALRGVSLVVKEGEICVLGGEAGSGKSLLARLVLGVQEPGLRVLGGSICFEGEDLLVMRDRERRAVRRRRMVFVGRRAEEVFNPARTVRESLREFARYHRGTVSRDERDWNDRFYRVGIVEPERILPRRLGELPLLVVQKVALMRGLLSGANLFVCDESTAELDRVAQNQFLELVCRLREDLGLTFLMAKGKLRGVESYADRVAIFYEGGILESGEVADIVRSPRFPYTQEFLACAPKLTDNPRAIAGISREAVREAEEAIHGATSAIGTPPEE